MNNEELSKLKTQVSEVIKHSQGLDFEPNVEDLISQWLNNKSPFIKLFGNQTKICFPSLVFHLDEKDKLSLLTDFCNKNNTVRWNPDLRNFIMNDVDGFFANSLSNSTEYNKEIIPEGMKMLKAFKYFIKDKEELDQLQTEASMVIQQDAITSNLYFSVDPLDFLSLSENNYNWRSCHALDGEYRAGNLSYMQDTSSIVCYVSNGSLQNIPEFPLSVPWNSKKWRMLLFLSENKEEMAASRQYPFFSKVILEAVRARMISLLEKEKDELPFFGRVFYDWSNWSNKYVDSLDEYSLNYQYYNIKGSLLRKKSFIKDNHPNTDRALQYNDLLYSTCYEPFFCFLTNGNNYNKNRDVFMVGSDVKCLKCGKNYIELPDSMMCNDCNSEEYADCAICGDRIRISDSYTLHNGSIICESCKDNECSVCAGCGDLFVNDDLRYSEKYDGYYCEECYAELGENNGN